VPIDSAFTLLILCGASFSAGLVDSMAGGGGLITLPVLLAAGLPPHTALATNKGQAAPGALTSFITFWRGDGLDRQRALVGFLLGALGSLIGARLVLAIPEKPLRPLVLALLITAALIVSVRNRLPKHLFDVQRPALWAGSIALIIGFYDGFFGPGTGSLLIVAFSLFLGDSLRRASGNAKVVNLASNVAALAIFTFNGSVLWRLALPMGICNIVGAALGSRLVLRRGDGLVRGVVLCVLFALVLKLLYDVWHA
jgi:uncharacterized membrane protein YfcA